MLAPGRVAKQFHQEVLDVERPAAGLEFERAKRGENTANHAGFFLGFAEGGLLRGFAVFDVAFGEDPDPGIAARFDQEKTRLGTIEPDDDGTSLLNAQVSSFKSEVSRVNDLRPET